MSDISDLLDPRSSSAALLADLVSAVQRTVYILVMYMCVSLVEPLDEVEILGYLTVYDFGQVRTSADIPPNIINNNKC